MLPIHFAPLQGYTEDVYRRLHHMLFGGVDCYYTPFLRIEHGGIRSKDMRDIRPEFNEGVPLVPQAIASSGKELEQLLAVVEQTGYKRLDINMGCPFPLQTRHGRGAGLLANASAVKEMCSVVEAHPDITFSVKMRFGLDDKDEWRQILPLLNEIHLLHITLHPRIATQQYKGEVDMQSFEDFLGQAKHPVIYNGDVTTIQQIEELESSFPGLAGVMIGRGLLARPSLAKEYKQGMELSERELITLIKQMHSRLLAHYEQIIPGEAQRLNKLRSFWDYLEPTIGRKTWKKITKAGNMKNYIAAVPV